ncbi:unnamed protein product [Trifolium pratense]|uniref:Uncharacterized protein n=1 Tax=Trifolium pratense TaxID=57577 RepID=A0ACB0JVW1_TRIPR|nr:unnamed protein product [Trifolium pratense]
MKKKSFTFLAVSSSSTPPRFRGQVHSSIHDSEVTIHSSIHDSVANSIRFPDSAIDSKDSPLSHLAPSIHPSLYYEIKALLEN